MPKQTRYRIKQSLTTASNEVAKAGMIIQTLETEYNNDHPALAGHLSDINKGLLLIHNTIIAFRESI